MAQPTRAQLRTRLEAVLDDITGLTLFTGTEELIASASLPAFRVLRPTVRRNRRAIGQVLMTLGYPVMVYIQALPSLTNDTDIDTAFDSCETWQDTIAAYLEARPNLQRNDSGLTFGMGDLECSQPGTMPIKGTTYAGFSITVPLTIIRST